MKNNPNLNMFKLLLLLNVFCKSRLDVPWSMLRNIGWNSV